MFDHARALVPCDSSMFLRPQMNIVPRTLKRLFTGTQDVRIVGEGNGLFVKIVGRDTKFEEYGGSFGNPLKDESTRLS